MLQVERNLSWEHISDSQITSLEQHPLYTDHAQRTAVSPEGSQDWCNREYPQQWCNWLSYWHPSSDRSQSQQVWCGHPCQWECCPVWCPCTKKWQASHQRKLNQQTGWSTNMASLPPDFVIYLLQTCSPCTCTNTCRFCHTNRQRSKAKKGLKWMATFHLH